MNTASSPNTASSHRAASRIFRSPFIELGLLVAVILVAVIASQCASAGDSADGRDPSDITGVIPDTALPGEAALGSGRWSSDFLERIEMISLGGFDECGALLDYLQGEALELVGPYGLEEPRAGWDAVFASPAATWPEAEEREESPRRSSSDGADADMADFSAAFAAPATTAAQSRAPSPAGSSLAEGADYSGTNVQVEGVDEADIVKTDGRRIIGISGSGELWVADVTQPVPRLRGRLTLRDGDFLELYLDGDRVFVIGNSSVGLNPPGSGGLYSSRTQGDPEGGTAGGTAEDAVVITEVDISDLDNPRVMRHLRVEGRYVSSRSADSYARVVVSSPPDDLGFVRPSRQSNLSETSSQRFNQLLIQESALEQWLPNYNLHAANGETISRGRLLDCDKVYAPSMFSGFNQVSVLSFATGKSLRLRDTASTMADGNMVYASADNLYVSQTMDDFGAGWRDAGTAIHKFSLSASGSVNYEASGAVAGSPLSQYAFHEYDGRLFVATTSGEWSSSESFVTVLEDDGRALKQVGKVGDLGRGEDIYAVRYIADKAYVVTFRQTDPLYVIDLSDPTDPTTEGELKITGYSAYLHPVGEDLLLGVGREATNRGRVTGAKVSLFDVSDPADPRTLDTLVLEGGSSEVEWDARAFLWWEPKELAVVPISDWNSSAALALRVNADARRPKIEEITRITHDRGSNSREILRSIVIKDDLWTLSSNYLQANDLDTLNRRAWLDIPG